MDELKRSFTEEELKNQLDIAIELAANLHKGQRDRSNEIYVFHPIRIMMKMETYEEKIVAILHDVVEDTDCTLEMLQNKLENLTVVEAIDAITRKEEEDYFDYIERVRKNSLAKKVKTADLIDNLSRQGATPSMRERYKKAYTMINGKDSLPPECNQN